MSQSIQLRRDTSANWASVNPVLAEGEIGLVTDDLSYKIGDGVTAWNSLADRTLTGNFGAAILMTAVANPTAPAAGNMNFYAHDIAGRMTPKWVGPAGLDMPAQSAIWANGVVLLVSNTTTTFSTIGTTAPTVVGTASTPAILAGTNLRSQMRRTIITSAATANSASEVRIVTSMCYRGEVFGSATAGGFFFSCRWGMSTAVANQRTAVGLFSVTTAIATTQSPSALTNCVFMGNDSGDTTMQIMHNDASGTCTKVNLGASFPSNSTTAFYETTFFCAPNGSTIGYRVVRLDTGDVASGTLSTDLPPASTLLTFHGYANNGGTASAVVYEQGRMYLETDY